VWLAMCSSAGARSEAEEPKKFPRIGHLAAPDPATESTRSEPFRMALRELGYREGQNIAIEYRYSGGNRDRAPELVAELVRLKVDIIVVSAGDTWIEAVKNATKTIPIVMGALGPILLRRASLKALPVPAVTSPA